MLSMVRCAAFIFITLRTSIFGRGEQADLHVLLSNKGITTLVFKKTRELLIRENRVKKFGINEMLPNMCVVPKFLPHITMY
jgi:hypothetical protein